MKILIKTQVATALTASLMLVGFTATPGSAAAPSRDVPDSMRRTTSVSSAGN
jgi:hypothetical protein